MQSERELRARQRRAEGRHTWEGGLTTTHEPAQLSTPEERLATMWQLAVDAWALQGAPLPDYARDAIPGRILRRG